MKICISTITDYNNYGNRLQNYALQKTLESLGFEAESLRNFSIVDNRNVMQKTIDVLRSGKLLDRILPKRKSKLPAEVVLARKQNFTSFTSDFIHETSFKVDQNTINFDFEKNYDYFIVGSDQVWNPQFQRFSTLDFIPYAEKKKRISYAASFGVGSIPDAEKNIYIQGLNGIEEISVREESGASIVKTLTGRTVPVVLDPTFLLKKEEWSHLIDEHASDGKFLLTYFLGTPSEIEMKYINDYAKANNLSIKHLNNSCDLDTWTSGPKQFIQLFSQATAIFTDSFHACAFSLIFEKPFIVFERHDHLNSMNSRIDTLLNTFHLNAQKFDAENLEFDIIVKYDDTRTVLEKERAKSFSFLKQALNIK
ncbi:polysaccharide pyruvyl transferase family protein [Enterococcus sp. CWB-B31]|uniref:polysaccharide pyruvyl transferase family protein n=1 Tax=Enterococcus sp. CWB-B31 TaxID=2885159 RepID=UPI001E407307|nr:polysaccharide pyruvyl transferase family protein [Enterococcus sp. CWB-B31]MCB5954624.1 polysaccharide pyruvyl transferase family protein [Enterococcus sp. CWB-B31]